MIKVILTKDVPDLGSKGDILDVADGYARNYLIPKGIAIPATAEKVKEVEHHRRIIEARQAEVDEDTASVGCECHVRGLDVPV